ncbi:bisdemethoxycurcumin synthase-like [Hordeum vulgare subsp. vulgare]|uniref:bisdemethoxycurcumin synthase-like n=1 Tax=Hordeum vulgare subsp. vulgare TaxID=112509 RepID=UPI001D1A3666|nr:bisdemethoxycurcumin synthase-like [Hordeum vulgare subsp. vulgare]
MAGSSSIPAATTVREIRVAQRADGPAAVLAIGTANPPHCVPQGDYPDYYFRVTNSDHLTHLKPTFAKLCGMTGIGRRFFHHTDELLATHPDWSLDERLAVVATAAPELAASAAANAIGEWGRPAGDITHLVVSTNAGSHAPGTDIRLVSLLGLRHDVLRTALQLNGCASGCAALRLAKDLAENNRGARVLVACVELTVTAFRGPDEADNSLIPQGLFGDGAGAVIVGADPHVHERPLFEMVLASQRHREDPEAGGDQDWGVMMGFGPGFTVETMLLHATT